MAGRGLVAGRPSAAQDANVIVVTAATAARYGLRSVADLARVAPRLAFGGPPECPESVYCLPGLKQAYGLRFRAFIPLDAGGPLTLQALEAGDIGVALLFSTDPAITAHTWWCWPTTAACSRPRTSPRWCAAMPSPATAPGSSRCSTRYRRG